MKVFLARRAGVTLRSQRGSTQSQEVRATRRSWFEERRLVWGLETRGQPVETLSKLHGWAVYSFLSICNPRHRYMIVGDCRLLVVTAEIELLFP